MLNVEGKTQSKGLTSTLVIRIRCSVFDNKRCLIRLFPRSLVL